MTTTYQVSRTWEAPPKERRDQTQTTAERGRTTLTRRRRTSDCGLCGLRTNSHRRSAT